LLDEVHRLRERLNDRIIRTAFFDTGMHGERRAVECVRRARRRRFDLIVVDGRFLPATFRQVRSVCARGCRDLV